MSDQGCAQDSCLHWLITYGAEAFRCGQWVSQAKEVVNASQCWRQNQRWWAPRAPQLGPRWCSMRGFRMKVFRASCSAFIFLRHKGFGTSCPIFVSFAFFFRHFFCHRRWSDEWNNILAELASFDCVYDSALWACMLAWWIRVCLDGERCCLCRNYCKVDTCCQVSARLAVASRVPLPWRSRSLPSYLCCRGSPLGVAASSEQC